MAKAWVRWLWQAATARRAPKRLARLSLNSPNGKQLRGSICAVPIHTALVVDDDPCLRMLMRAQLSRVAIASEVAADGIEATELLQRGRYDLMITDLRMPKMGGLELLTWCWRQRPEMPGILMTGDLTALRTIQHALDTHRTLVLPKPISSRVLVNTVQALRAAPHGRSGAPTVVSTCGGDGLRDAYGICPNDGG
ncbi:MAG: response regulator [Deltaproteobacteria bacterium]|nr:MAG: response regulator [Deltaproteobacteria bacterium]